MFKISNNLNCFEQTKVKSFIRKGKVVKSHSRKIDKKKQNNILKNSTIIAASALGVGFSSYLLLKNKYRKGINSSAEWALKKANEINVPDLSDKFLNKPNINFAVGGLWYNKATRESTELASFVEKRFKGYTKAVNTNSFNTLSDTIPKNPLSVVLDMKTTGIKNALLKGYNPTSRELAAEMYAYHKKYPDHIITAFGHSTGGTITNEALLILEKMGVNKEKIKGVTYGANYYGILPPSKNSLNIVDINDIQANPFSFPGATTINKKKKKLGKTIGERMIEDHGAYHYTSSKEAIDKIKNFIKPDESWKPKNQAIKKSSSKVETNKGLVSQEVNLLRKSRQDLLKLQEQLDKANKNSNIPKDKKEDVINGIVKKILNAKEEKEIRYKKFKRKIAEIRNSRENQ